MTGSLQIKRGKYYAVLNMKDELGQRKTKWIPIGISAEGNNKRVATKALRRTITEYENKNIVYSKDIYFVDWLRDCVKNSKNRVELTTWEGYECYFRVHLEPYFTKNKVKLKDVTPKHIKDYYNYKLEKGRADGKGGLSANSIKHHKVILHSALKEAVHNDIIAYNPCDRVKMPQSKEKFKGKFYTEE